MKIKQPIVAALLLVLSLSASAQQVDWKRFDRLIDNGQYKSAFTQAKKIYDSETDVSQRLAAAFWMTRAAYHYQEDVYDSAVARYRALLPQLDSLDRALCYAFLHSYDTALMYAPVLQRTKVGVIQHYCENRRNTLNMTPTAYDVIVTMMQDDGLLDNKECAVWQRKLCEFHRGDGDELRIWHDMRLLEYLRHIPNYPFSTDTIQAYINKYRGTESPYVTQLYYFMASEFHSKDMNVQAVDYCDTALQIAPKSIGGIDCANLRAEITKIDCYVADGLTTYPGMQSLLHTSYRNTNHLWFRLIPYYEKFTYSSQDNHMRQMKPLMEWDLAVPSNNEYRQEQSFVAMPDLKVGRYILMVSPTKDFRKPGFKAFEVQCTDMQLVESGHEGVLLDRRTGRPISGQEVKVVKTKYSHGKSDTVEVATTRTDRDGRYRFDADGDWSSKLVIDRGGFRLESRYGYGNGANDTAWKEHTEIRTDRPIYKPGDTLHVAVLRYVSDGLEAMAAKGFEMSIVLKDPNYKEVLRDTLTTDEYGMASTTMVLPKDRLPGLYRLYVMDGDRNASSTFVRVEEYKQPKFMVELGVSGEDNGAEAPAFGVPYTVKGLAASYSAVPVSGAKVKYTIVRRKLHRWWWRYAGGDDTEVVEDETTTAADGSFEITFTPEPDSSVDLSTKPCFEYRITVDVTDINGESHPATTTVRVGFRNAFIALDGDAEIRSLDVLKPRYFDLNGNNLPGKVDMKIERLHQPDVPLFNPPSCVALHNVHQTMSETEYRKAFPLYAYDLDYNNREKWPVESAKGKDESGVYRVTLTADGADTVVAYCYVTADGARKVQSQKLLWYDLDKHTVEVGDTVTLRFGSRFRDVEVHYCLRIGNEERDFRRVHVSDQLKTIRIPIDSTMLGGISIDLFAAREGIKRLYHDNVSVPFSHKKLNVEIVTFRDRLQPGETEEWTVRVKSGERKVESALVMTMYDDALNSYGDAQVWGFSPWRVNSSRYMNCLHLSRNIAWHMNYPSTESYNGYYPSVWRLLQGLPTRVYYGRLQGNTLKRSAKMRYEVADSDEIILEEEVPVIEIGTAENGMRITSDDIQRMPGTSVESIVAAVGGVGYSDGGAMSEMVVQTAEESAAPEPEPQIRTNLNTLAFFVPGLRTDSSGTATYRFTVPELLTRWNVRGLAVTKDIKIGTLDKTLVTSKQLMVQPNMPRFLRHGDSIVLMAKVMNLTDCERKVCVTFSLDNAADDRQIIINEQVVVVGAQGSVQVTVPISNLPRNLYVATYQIVAQTIDDMFLRPDLPHLSDGERGQLPVISNRQAVTISQAMYINGVGEKQYRMPEFLVTNGTREPRLVAAEVVSNPIWMAIKSMPYLKLQESPSTIYLANQYYVNTLGHKILDKIGNLEILDTMAKSRLSINEDVKQTLLQATPWLQDAECEVEQMAAVANYFNPDELNRTLEKSVKELQQRQNTDGGWGWMPEGESSVWVTQQVLKKIDGERFNIEAALEYIDREHQRDYDKYIKPYLLKKLLCGVTDIDYLYTRSNYGKAKTEAYRYYYSNALKTYKEYENLYTQAQLALIFHRHGDHKAALDLLHRLKQKALESDEMGMYWRDNNSGWFWYQRPIETQALVIQAFAEIAPEDTVSIGLMQQWLIKQKQTTHWGNDQATTKAIAALMVGQNGTPNTVSTTSLTVFGESLTADPQGPEGYHSQRWTDVALDTLVARRSSLITLKKESKGMAWGAVYYQFADDIDKIPSSEMGITLKRSYMNQSNQIIQNSLKVGDRIKVRIEISCDRDMDYLELVDGRPSCVEPISTRAGWRWSDGLAYYITVNNTDTRCYIEHIDKGKYVFEYEVYVANPGSFMAGPVTMQCMYAPEFRAVSPGQRIVVE